MKQEKLNFAQLSRTVLWLSLIVCVGLTAARAQVIPTVCFESKPETLTRTLTANVAVRWESFRLDQAVPSGFYRVVINPNGSTRESFVYGSVSSSGTILTISITGLPSQSTSNAHAVGETVLLTTDGEAVFGYNNTSSTTVTIPRGIFSHNFFAPGASTFLAQPQDFQPGVHENVMRLKAISGFVAAWHLNGGVATPSVSAGPGCGTITFQGRLSDAGAAANGQFDLQFQAFDTLTDGTAQSDLIPLEDVQVTNGIFTVPLFFGSTLTNNFKARFLQIGVRPGNAPNADPFTTLTPRQPITSVPYAVNAQIAQTAATAANAINATNVSGGFVQLPLTTNAPPTGECNAASQYGRQKVDAANSKLWVCTAAGWKSTVLQ